MPRGVAFDDLLDEKLAVGPIDSTPVWTSGPAGMATAYGFFFVDMPRTAAAPISISHEQWAGRQRASFDGAAAMGDAAAASIRTAGVRVQVHIPVPECSSAPARPERQRRRLSPREQVACDELATLGGALPDGFTFAELRSVFRALARRYHPDRHADCRDDDRTRLAQQFTRARDAYRVLAEHFTRVN